MTEPVFLDPRISDQALQGIVSGEAWEDPPHRWFLMVAPENRGKVHRWTDQYGNIDEQVLNTDAVETTSFVRERIRRAIEAVYTFDSGAKDARSS